MDNDNLMPLDGRFFAEPRGQVQERDQEIADTIAAIPLLKEVLDHLNQRLDFYNTNQAIPSEVLTQPEAFMHIVAGNKVAHDNLIVERDYILSRIEATKR